MEFWKGSAAGWWMEPTASLRVSAGASRTITSAPRSGFCGFLLLHGTHIFPHTPLCLLSSHLAVLPPFSYRPPSLPARLGSRTSPGGWIRGRFPVAVGCNPEVQAEPSQSPPWAGHVPDLWHQASEGHIGLLGEDALLLDAGRTEQPAGQQRTGLERVVVLCSPVWWTPTALLSCLHRHHHHVPNNFT